MPDSRTPDSLPADLASRGQAPGAPATADVALDGLPDAPVERSLGRYRVRHRVGAGGFARVYRALDPELELDVALKILKPELAAEPETVERFRREASTAAKLRHPNVVTVLNVGRLDDAFDGAPAGTPYLVMDFLPSSLEKRLAERGSIPEAELARVGEDVARGLAYAHERGVVHRDVKPDNVLFAADGRAMVSDFGIARAVDARVSSVSRQVVLGTPSYFSPEQARGLPLDGRSDIYALGVTLYQAATGALPFGGDDWYDVMRQHVEATPPSPRERAPHLSPTFEAVLLRCLAKDPGDRFQSSSELADALSALRAHGAEAATMAVPAYPAQRPRGSRGRRVVGGLLGLAAAAGVAAWLLLSDSGAETRARLAPGSIPRVDSSIAQSPAPDTLAGGFADSLLTVPSVALLTVDAPPTATVSVDGTTLPRAAWRGDSIAPGRHVLRGTVRSLDGCPTAVDRQTVDLTAGEQRTVQLRPTPCGELTIAVGRPARAQFAVTPKRGNVGGQQGTLPLAAPLVLPEGWYQVRVQAALCAPYDDSVRVTGTTPARVRLNLICD
ncbi:MAG: serine/threonine-protein kinase [Gemmatirosa sp.]